MLVTRLGDGRSQGKSLVRTAHGKQRGGTAFWCVWYLAKLLIALYFEMISIKKRLLLSLGMV